MIDAVHILAAVLATWRLTDLITADRIALPIRQRFNWYVLSCPRCVSVWAGVAVTIAFILLPWINWPLALSWLYISRVETTQLGGAVRIRRNMRAVILAIVLLWASQAQANTLTWTDNSTDETGFAIEMLVKGVFQEVARVGANVVTYTDALTQGVYRVRAFITTAGDGDVFSTYSNTAAKLNAPVNLNVK